MLIHWSRLVFGCSRLPVHQKQIVGVPQLSLEPVDNSNSILPRPPGTVLPGLVNLPKDLGCLRLAMPEEKLDRISFKELLTRTLVRLPPFNIPVVRKLTIRLLDRFRRLRRLTFEKLGSDRYSRPSLFQMDRKLEQYLPEDGGTFIEAGAYDGYEQSNTYYLERFKQWKGILIEPIPELFRKCVKERPHSRVFECALVAPEHEGKSLNMVFGGLMSVATTDEDSEKVLAHASAGNRLGWDKCYEVKVPGRTISSIIDECEMDEIDFLSLDLEGYEDEALKGLDIERHKPRFILIESLENHDLKVKTEKAIESRYKVVAELSPYDTLYTRT